MFSILVSSPRMIVQAKSAVCIRTLVIAIDVLPIRCNLYIAKPVPTFNKTYKILFLIDNFIFSVIFSVFFTAFHRLFLLIGSVTISVE